MGCYVCAGVTGAQPAVTLALAVHRRCWHKGGAIMAQIVGAFVLLPSSVTYHEALAAFDGSTRRNWSARPAVSGRHIRSRS
jgi:glycerol uptake facilitator-like aquaporin